MICLLVTSFLHSLPDLVPVIFTGIDSSIFDELNPEDRRGVLLLQVGCRGD